MTKGYDENSVYHSPSGESALVIVIRVGQARVRGARSRVDFIAGTAAGFRYTPHPEAALWPGSKRML